MYLVPIWQVTLSAYVRRLQPGTNGTPFTAWLCGRIPDTGKRTLTLLSSSARCCWTLNFTVWYKPKLPPSRKAQPSNPPLPLPREESTLVRTTAPPVPYALLDPLAHTFPTGLEKVPGRRAAGHSKILQPTLQSVLAQAAAMLVLHKVPECTAKVNDYGFCWPEFGLPGCVLLPGLCEQEVWDKGNKVW